MNRTATIVVAIALVSALVAVPLGASAFATDAEEAQNATDSIEPGERLAGVVGVQEAEVNGEVSERTYGVKIANAQTDAAKADVVGDQLDEIEERLKAHETTLDQLADAREAGEIDDGEYRAKVATVAAEKATTERLAEHAQATAGELPEELLKERGIDVDAIRELRAHASELGGPETAEIARSIAGDSVGHAVALEREPGAPVPTPAETESPADRVDAELERASGELERAADRIDRAADRVDEDDEDAQAALERATAALEEAEAAFDRAADVADEDAQAAIEHAEEATEYATEATEHAEEAIDRTEAADSGTDRGVETDDAGQ
ncbi:hypothetical protein [Natronobeatus ordinarius]|uniref:hypothetical protein n=1 Tax=Natronobeatus ordinarius TaxID=2963433 RepID=UPI0020CF8E84|nr:hypothetical protein [Natronobeatus ordinarius]